MSVPLVGVLALATSIAYLLLAALSIQDVRPIGRTHPEAAILADAGWARSFQAWEALRVATTGIGLLVGVVTGPAWLGAVLGALAPSVVARLRAARAHEAAARERTVILQMAHAALRSGTSISEALRLATAGAGQLARYPFTRSLRDFDMGAPLDVALRAAAAETRDRRTSLALDAIALAIGERLPTSRCAGVVGSVAEWLVFQERLADDLRARTSGLRWQAVVLAAVVPCLALYLIATMPGLGATLSTPLCRFVLLPLAAILEIVGIVATRRMMGSLPA